ncbi:MAG: hypothetical protein ABSE47_07965 [Acidimicrobiales bacterium]
MNDHAEHAGREVVRAPDRSAGGIRPSPQVADLYEPGSYGRVLLSSLVRAQLGLAVAVLAPLAATVIAIPLLATLWPHLVRLRVLGLPLFLLILGLGVYPPLVLAGWWYVRRAEALERSFTELMAEQRDE